MLSIKKETYINKIFLIILSLIFPVVVLAPLGAWIPLVLIGIISFFFLKNISKNFTEESLNLIIIISFIWILLNIFVVLKNLLIIEKVFQLYFLILSGLIASKLILQISNLKKSVVIFYISFMLSAVLVILDTKFNLGLKLWLSKNFDFSNFENFYKLKHWISLIDFKDKYFDLIISYNNSSYHRGVIALIVFSFPLFAMCIFYKYKKFAFIILFINFLLAFLTTNLSIIFCTAIGLFFGTIFYFNTKKFKKYFLLTLAIYFILCPFFLGVIDYRKFSEHENNLIQKRNDLFIKYCGNNHNNNSLFIKNISLYIKCFDIDEKLIGPFPQKFNIISYNFLELGSAFENIKLYLNYSYYTTFLKKMHRLIIWSYVKEKILEKPLLGHGFLSSGGIDNEARDTKNFTKYELIPLHPHNSILEIWLELGVVGIIIFFIFIKILFNRIYNFDRINHKIASVSIISFFQIFFIGQISFSFWQSWWIGVILITFIFYKIVFKLYGFYKSRLDTLN